MRILFAARGLFTAHCPHAERALSLTTALLFLGSESNTISVYNTGKGIPVQMHTKEKIYIPELIFGNLLTGANFDDSSKKVGRFTAKGPTGGRS